MKKKWSLTVIMLASILLLPTILLGQELEPSATSGDLSPSDRQQPTDQIIIRFEQTADFEGRNTPEQQSRLDRLSQAVGMPLQYVRPMSGEAHVLKLPAHLSLTEVKQVAASLEAVADVAYAEPDAIMRPDGRASAPVNTNPNDTNYAEQWHYQYTPGTAEGLNLPPAWDITTGSSSIVVAVIDTGILNHADLAGRTVPGYDFIADVATANDGNGRDADPSDPGDWVGANECGYPHAAESSSWHGTHVAGTIGATSNNGIGVAGVNWQSKILPVRVLGKCGGYTSDIVDGMRWAAGLSVVGVPANSNPAKVLNLSLGGPGACSATYQNAINAIVNTGSTVVVAAGNSNDNAGGYSPASCNNVITVASTNRTGSRSYYSNYGATVEVSAPGGETNVNDANGILSTLNTGTTSPGADAYVFYQGTSMAAPHVSGLASLILSVNPGFSPAQVLERLQSTVRPFPAGSTCNTSQCGAGIIDAYQALSVTPFIPTDFVYLPTVLVSASTLPPPPPPVNLVNGDFESGPTGWSEFSAQGWPLILHVDDLEGILPHSGNWSAWLGGDHSETAYIQQQVTVPAATPYLAYWHWIASLDVCGYDFGIVSVNGSVVDQYTLCSTESTEGWEKHVVNLSAYAGQSVALEIRVETDASLVSSLFVDDVTFQATPASGDTSTGLEQNSTLLPSKPEWLAR